MKEIKVGLLVTSYQNHIIDTKVTIVVMSNKVVQREKNRGSHLSV